MSPQEPADSDTPLVHKRDQRVSELRGRRRGAAPGAVHSQAPSCCRCWLWLLGCGALLTLLLDDPNLASPPCCCRRPAWQQGKTRALALLAQEQLLASLHTHASHTPDRVVIRDKGLRPKVKARLPAAPASPCSSCRLCSPLLPQPQAPAAAWPALQASLASPASAPAPTAAAAAAPHPHPQVDLPRDDSQYVSLAASADGSMVCTGGERYTHLLDPRAGEVVHKVSGRAPPARPLQRSRRRSLWCTRLQAHPAAAPTLGLPDPRHSGPLPRRRSSTLRRASRTTAPPSAPSPGAAP